MEGLSGWRQNGDDDDDDDGFFFQIDYLLSWLGGRERLYDFLLFSNL